MGGSVQSSSAVLPGAVPQGFEYPENYPSDPATWLRCFAGAVKVLLQGMVSFLKAWTVKDIWNRPLTAEALSVLRQLERSR